jgi:hypothetical protein
MALAALDPSGEAPLTRHTRRTLFGTAAGATGAAMASRLLGAVPAVADDGHGTHRCRARPIPGGLRPFAPQDQTLFHVLLPGVDPATGQLNEPSTVTDFVGLVGLADVQGTGTETNLKTGEQREGLLWEADLRFMTGHIADESGRQLSACTFGFVWLDVFTDQFDPDHQIHDFNPGIARNGLFWTVPLPDDAVAHDHLPDRRARLTVRDLRVEDFGNLINALKDGPSVPARVSFDVSWAREGAPLNACDEANTFQGTFLEVAVPEISWTGRTRRTLFETKTVTKTVFALVGHEDNGIFHDCEESDAPN